MPAMFVFLLKVNIALLLFCAGYYLVLRHLTFYTLNRVYLVSAILFASIYPQINLDSFAQRHQQLTQPVQVILNLQAPAQHLIAPIAQTNYWYWVEVVFWIGAALLALRLLMQLYSLYKLYRSSSPANIHGHEVRKMTGDSGPFSFWKSIYVNPDNHHPDDLRSILLHEQVHVNQWHTLDILLAEVSTIFYWFNPGIWLMKRAVRENIEFITDNKILNKGVDTKAYQYSLVNVSFSASPQNIVNHFNLSTIKKRIIMMNAKRSSKFNLTRYAFLMPAVIALLLVFSVSKAAFVTKSNKVMHTLATTINSINILHPATQNITISKPAAVIPARKINLHAADTTHAINTQIVLVDDTTKKITKKLIYIVDGILVKDYDFNKIDPTNIVNITAGQAEDGKQSVIYVITKNGVTRQPVTKMRINGKNLYVTGAQLVDGKLVYDSTKVIGGVVIDSLRANRRMGGGGRRTIGVDTVVSVRTVGGVGRVYTNVVPGNPALRYGIVTGYRSPNITNVGNLSDKLFVIDGKPATDKQVKNLSMLSIEHLTVKTDDETKSLYGDKSKNGVVFITTKKDK